MNHRMLVTLGFIGALFCSTQAVASFGRTAGQFTVSTSGAAQYTIPIWALPGPRGIQPAISLLYNSQAGIGTLGIGWSLTGLGAIMRCNQTYAQNGTPAPVALAVSDGYCLNGNLLRLTAGTYGTAGSTYQTEIADFSNVTANGTAGNGPASFTVQGRDGLTYEYGYTDTNGNGAGSQVLATGTSTASEWLLSKVIDRTGNNYVINYTTEQGTAVPNTILWTPTSAGASTYTYKMQFNYSTNVPQSSPFKYIAGTVASNTALLSSIEILASGTVVKDYFLGYQASPTTGREELISVKECADSAPSNCLLPTNVTYQSVTMGVSTTATTAVSSSGYGLTARYDLNGDGYPDLVYTTSGGATYVAFGSASGYGTPVNTGTPAPQLIGKLTGGSKESMMTVVSGVWWVYTWNGSSFTGTSTGTAYDSATYGYQLADINGDGLPDLIDLDETYNSQTNKTKITINARLNTSSGSTASFSSTVITAYTLGGTDGAQLQTPDMQYGKLRRYDFNGDGRDDLALMVVTGTAPYFILKTYELLSTGTAFTASLIASVGGSVYTPVFYTNWNDDACTDYVTLNTLYVSGCNGSVPQTFSLSGTILAAMDWNGDGRSDLVVANGSTLGVYLSTGSGVGTLLATSVPYASNCAYFTIDVYGDGLDDLGCWSQTSPNPFYYYLHNGTGAPPDLMTSVTDGYGNSASPTYLFLTSGANASQSTDAAYPYQNYVGPLYEVYKVVFSDPSNQPGGTYYQQYYYTGAWANVQGLGFSGFESLQKYDSRNALWEQLTFNLASPYNGMLSADVLAEDQLNTKPVNKLTNTLQYLTLNSAQNNERYYPYVLIATNQRYEVGGAKNGELITTTTTNYGTPDSYDNYPSVSTTITDNDIGSPYYTDSWLSTTATAVSPDAATWCVNLPSQTTITNSSTAPGGSAITRTVSYTPDYTNCRETQKITEPNSSSYKVTESYMYDSFGNLWTDTVTGIGMAARVTTITWGTTGQFPTTVTNPLSQSVTLGYDPGSGNLTSMTDPNYTVANPIQTTWGYDPFQRKISEARPDSTSTTWGYNSCATNGCVNNNNHMTVTQTNVNYGGTTESVTNTYLDAMDRTLVTSRQMLSGAYDRNEVQYNSLGLVKEQGAPCTFVSCTNYSTNFTYDVLNRLTQSQRPISATNSSTQTTTYGYAGRTATVTDPPPLNNTTTKIYLVTGALARSTDAKGYYQNFTYDAFGSLLKVTDSGSNTLATATYQYGIGAFRTASTDMDSGARTYTIDALGEVIAYSDAKTQNFSVIYDALSRPTTRTEPDLTTTWTWGNAAGSYNIDRLQSVSSAGSTGTYSESYTYDSKTRLSVKSITIPLDATYAYTYTYSATTGFLDTLQYPVSTSSYQLKLQYAYAYGLLESIADYNAPSTVFWTANATNPRGQVTQETLGNGVVTNRSYDAVTSWINYIQAGVGGGAALLNSSYLFDEMGNLTQRQNGNAGLTENFYYDADYRLSYSQLNGATNLQMVYDTTGMGNIASRSDVAGGATWTYDPVRKHAVTEAGSSSYLYSYDANGNMTSRSGNNVTWTSYNYPSGISSTGESVAFQYGPNRQRWQTIYTGSIGTETTYHVGGLLEKAINAGVTDYRHYIFAGNEPVAIYSRQSSGTNTLRYVLGDYQGSFASILTSTGTSLVNESFTAYGNRRNGSTWSGAPTSGDETTINGVSRWGYTGETVLGVSMGLNHLNGRVEDAITGRFLSPDPYVPNPSDPQSFNRYSYVLNNPLTLVDPSGFSSCVPAVEGSGAAIWNNNFDIIAGMTVSYSSGDSGVCFSEAGGLYFLEGWPTGNNTPAGGGGSSGASKPPVTTPPAPSQIDPAQGSTLNKVLCQGGNSLQSVANGGASLGTTLEQAGLAVAGLGFVAGGPAGAVPGLALATIGGAITLTSTGAQVIGGTLQLFSDPSVGTQNITAGSASIFTAGAVSFVGNSFLRSGNNFVARAYNQNVNMGTVAGGGAIDVLQSLSDFFAPKQASCN